MVFFGWGRRAVQRQVNPGQVLVLVYGYFHLFWLFRVSWKRGYELATATEHGWAAHPLPADQAAALDPDGTLQLHWWWRWGLLAGLAALVVVLTVGSMFGA